MVLIFAIVEVVMAAKVEFIADGFSKELLNKFET
jgi:hypothetical protein